MLRPTHQYWIAAALRCAAALLISLLAASAAPASPFEFANFHLLNATQPLSFTNGVVSASLQALNVPVIFNFTTQSGLSTADHAGTLTINPATPTILPSTASGSLLDQPISPFLFSITENGTGKNLLSMLAVRGDLVGISGGVNASLSGVNTNIFSSSFGTFGVPANQSFNFGLTTLSAPLAVGPGEFLNSFVANVNGQFSVDTGGFTPSPEPASIVLFGTGLLIFAAVARRKTVTKR